MLNIYDASRLFKVRIVDRSQCSFYSYKPAFVKKTWFGLCRKQMPEGFYGYQNSLVIATAEIVNNTFNYSGYRMIVEDNIVYYSPYVELTFITGKSNDYIQQYFNTSAEALQWGREQASKGFNVQIEVNDNI